MHPQFFFPCYILAFNFEENIVYQKRKDISESQSNNIRKQDDACNKKKKDDAWDNKAIHPNTDGVLSNKLEALEAQVHK